MSLFDSAADAVAAVGRGEVVVVLDDEHRENEGDLVVAASAITAAQMAWLIRHSSGFICIALTPERIAQLELPMMVPHNTDPNETAYTVTLDYRHDTTTGISARDRAVTARMLANVNGDANRPAAQAADFSRPGHMCPLRYTEGGVRVRMGHTEASMDLCKLAGLPPAALLCELVDPDDPEGGIASRDACLKFAKQHNLKVINIELLRQHREQTEGPLPPQLQSLVQDKRKQDHVRGVEADTQQIAGPAL